MAGKIAIRETLDRQRIRARKILARLRRAYGPVATALRHDNALQLLISTILSAQSTDDTINRITPALFERYPDAQALADAPRSELEQAIYQSGFFRQKAKSIHGTCRMIMDRFDGQVPATMEELVELPGVARKTANVVLGSWFGKNEGIVVDTHVGRLAERMGLTRTARSAKDAVRIENDLMELIPRRNWTFLSHALIRHGRTTCAARKPDCKTCPVALLCPSAGTFE